MRHLIGSTTSPRTGVYATTILGCRLCPVEKFKQSIKFLDAIGIANDLSGASVENRVGLSNNFLREY
jgi:hypothetical protein